MFMIVFRAGYLIIKLHNISHSTCKCRVKQHKRTCTCIENKITFSILYTKGPTVPLIGTSYTKLTLMQFLNWLLALVLKLNLTRFVVKCQISTSGGHFLTINILDLIPYLRFSVGEADPV